MRNLRALLAVCSLTLLTAGCKHKETGKGPDGTYNSAYDTAPDPSQTGSVSGTVDFSGTPPERVKIDMSQDPACNLTGADNLAEQFVVGTSGPGKGKLANVFVYVKGAPRLAPSAMPGVIDQKGCRFVPHVLAIQAGGTVLFKNSDPTMHNIHDMAVEAGNKSLDLSQGPGAAPDKMKFETPENMVPVRCNNHPWMNAFVNVSPNGFYAVTGPDGTFKIQGLPAGNYTLVLVHEKMGEQDLPVTVKPQGDSVVPATFYLR